MKVKVLFFDSELELMVSLSDYDFEVDETVIALSPIGAYQVQMIFPSAPLKDYYYRMYLLDDLEPVRIFDVYYPYQIPKDFPQADIKVMLRTLKQSGKIDINYLDSSLETIYETEDEEKENTSPIQPRPLLFSYIDNASPINRPKSVDIEQLEKEIEGVNLS